MQSRISSFFKAPPSSSRSVSEAKSPERHEVSGDDFDELDVWEKTEHQISSTYSRRPRNLRSFEKDNVANGQLVEKMVSDDYSPKPLAPTVSGKTVVKNKKRSYAQFHLEFGQSDFVLHTCSTCRIKYVAGDENDEKIHKDFHKEYTHGIQFKGWLNERVISRSNTEGGRIIMVLDGDSPAHRNKVGDVVKMMEIELGSGWIFNKHCKVFLFIKSQRVAGCVVAEPIEKAFKVVLISENRGNDATKMKKEREKPTTLKFGTISFRREVAKQVPADINTKQMDEDFRATILCEKEAVPAVCGIRAIWVSPANRRKHIATQLLDAVRKTFCSEIVIEPSKIAFSQPTLAGKALASYYIGGRAFLVYKSNNLKSDELS